MNYYRACLQDTPSGGASDYSPTYSMTVGGTLQKSSFANFFSGNTTFNEEVIIGDNVGNCFNMFKGCYNLNSPVTIGNNVFDCSYMFHQCSSFGQDIIFPATVNNLFSCFQPFKNINIYIKGTTYRFINTFLMIQGTSSSVRKNIFFNQVLNNQFNATNRVWTGIVWTAMTNGFYNTGQNIYCYYNYSG